MMHYKKNRGRDRNVNQPDEVVTVSNQEVASEITPSNERSGVGLQDIIHSVALEQDIIEASILQFNKKKKEANQENFCSKCDMITHRKLVPHNREVCENGENLKFLRQNEFISEDGYITVEECKNPHSCSTKPGSRDVTVVTANGK
ncbi:hypothetical protein DAPPUDRAFT_117336 [Daphnia pulex]|uniref:Uncharacterized protein n=1 Tax=Daphnia pulex TaxID=6669 RepID=E9HSC4_DAPPU|nr:hypothetical protein DAPPUDRAFT_117336 [Daphnia pulex]|eukprot:EFX65343.1 hypothetical protein DAPPUDRAFT_117336 [Daphnia pulex]